MLFRSDMLTAITAYENTSLISPFLQTLSVGSGNILSANVINDVETLATGTCYALSNSIPPDYSSLGTQMTTVVIAEAQVDICSNNVSKLAQAVNQAQGYSS